MKIKLLLFLFLFFTFYYSKAQQIELIGQGVVDKTEASIQFTELSNIQHVDVGAIFKKEGDIPPSSGVLFKDSDEGPTSNWNTDIVDKNPFEKEHTKGYYTAIFNSVDNQGIKAKISVKGVHSYYALIYRDIFTSSYLSYSSLEMVFFYHNGSNNPYVYKIPINTDIASRDITVKIPITELDASGRMVVMDIKAGPKSHRAVETTFNFGNSFFLGEYTLKDVPGNVTEVSVSIYSPLTIDKEFDDGDSFFVSGIVVDVEKVGCTLTQGYWKNHSDCKTNGNGKGKGPERDNTWDLIKYYKNDESKNLAEFTPFFKAEEDTYCDVFDTNPGKGGKYYILAHQYIAAELNLLAGANPSAIEPVFIEATKFLKTYAPQQVKGNKSLEAKCVYLGGILDDFNNGRIGPGHCDDDDDNDSGDDNKKDEEKSAVSIYPNPASSYSKIEFISNQNANTTVELYNVRGQKIGVLYNSHTRKGSTVNIEYNTEQFKKGLYFLIIKNGSDVYKEKISIIK